MSRAWYNGTNGNVKAGALLDTAAGLAQEETLQCTSSIAHNPQPTPAPQTRGHAARRVVWRAIVLPFIH